MSLLGSLWAILSAAADILDAMLEFLAWREDWDKTWSPASYWLATISGVVLLLIVSLYGQALWRYVGAGAATEHVNVP